MTPKNNLSAGFGTAAANRYHYNTTSLTDILIDFDLCHWTTNLNAAQPSLRRRPNGL
ncbi:hypothetical protein AGR1B_pa0178 [Agrobacterium fabacearum S56]|nr:hypothetical protein AGR1B_pa0178 [Agrobacterium fabacearum S56]